MKITILLLFCASLVGCETAKCAKNDWNKFTRSVVYWNNQPAVMRID